MKLVYEKSGKAVEIGDLRKIGEGEYVRITGIQEPHKSSSTGRVYTQAVAIEEDESEPSMAYYPSVVGAKWINREDR